MEELQLSDAIRSPGFARIQDRIRAQRDQAVKLLINAATWDEARRIQGEIHAIDRSLAVPLVLQREDKEKKKRP